MYNFEHSWPGSGGIDFTRMAYVSCMVGPGRPFLLILFESMVSFDHFATLPIYVAPSICAVCYLLCPWAPLRGPLRIIFQFERIGDCARGLASP